MFASYLRIRSSATSAASPELAEARSELESALQDLNADLQDLVDSVRAVESDPYRYGLELEEVSRRRRLVEDVGNEVEGMREELLKRVQNERSKGMVGGSSGRGDSLPDPSTFDDQDEYAAFEQERQLEMIHEQDEALDGVFKTVGNLRQQADDMGRELEEQGQLLEDVDNVADRVGGKLQNGIKRVGWVLKKNEGALCVLKSLKTFLTSSTFRNMVELLHRGAHICTNPTAGSCSCSLNDRRIPDADAILPDVRIQQAELIAGACPQSISIATSNTRPRISSYEASWFSSPCCRIVRTDTQPFGLAFASHITAKHCRSRS